ncbi:MAG: D-alanyl-D-alanine carboxypeptidase family protein [Clostridia bacterium]|nr:D-alanyl-D-alanine carboxypeptidase family protein [Clostridia bacterium]
MTSATMQLSPDRIQYLKKRKVQKGRAQFLLIVFGILSAAIFLGLLIATIANAGSLFGQPSNPSQGNTPGTAHSAEYQSFSTLSSAKASGALILVNSTHEYVFPQTEDNLVNIYNGRNPVGDSFSYKVSSSSLLLDSRALAALNNMMDAFYTATGEKDAIITSAYRSKSDQEKLNSDTKPGFSDFHTGYLVSVKVFDGNVTVELADKPVYSWLSENCYKYGFIIRYPAGKEAKTGVSDYTNTFRYVGVAHAAYIHEHNLCLEEYIELLHNYPYEGEHLNITAGENTYEVYYIPASEENTTTIYRTEDAQVSGDNESGFIITVSKN